MAAELAATGRKVIVLEAAAPLQSSDSLCGVSMASRGALAGAFGLGEYPTLGHTGLSCALCVP